jgi:hypothetical protein
MKTAAVVKNELMKWSGLQACTIRPFTAMLVER